MNIVVCVKQVPDTSEVKIDPVTNNLVREGIPGIMNPFDKAALREALRIRDKLGGRITVVSMGPPQAAETLEEALAMGADRALLLSDRAIAGSDTLATGYALSVLIRTLKPGLILCGSEAIDGCTGQVGPSIAENLGLPQVSYVNKISEINEKNMEVSREVKEWYEIIHCPLPALVCVLKNIGEPDGSGIGNAEKTIIEHSAKKVEFVNAANIGLETDRIGVSGSPTRVVKIDISGKRTNSFVVIDSALPADERIMLMINGGMVSKKINLVRGNPLYLAEYILDDEVLSGHLRN